MAPEDQSWNVFGNLMLPLMFPHSAVDQGELQSCEEELTLAWERCSCCRGAARLGFWVGPCLGQMGAGVWKEEYGLERGKILRVLHGEDRDPATVGSLFLGRG